MGPESNHNYFYKRSRAKFDIHTDEVLCSLSTERFKDVGLEV